ncbi:MAG TPA: hypothetical protein VGK19_04395 [Capsulimonadaceae bacterium]|jgi:hypothetical protein
MKTVSILESGIAPNTGEDASFAVGEALAGLVASGGGTLVFPRGRYDFWPDRAAEHYLFVSNNDEGLQRVAFPLFGCSGINVRGEDALFVFHGAITPFAIRDSRDVTISGITIDYERTFISEGSVLGVSAGSDAQTVVDVRIPEEYPYAVADERLVFLGERREAYHLGNILEWNPARRETEFRVYDNYSIRTTHRAREIEPGVVALTAKFSTVPTVGNVLAMEHSGRENPGITIAGSSDIVLTDVTFHHTRGMAVIAQWTHNIRLERVKVIPAAHKGRIISAAADATHFVNCRGLVELIDCVFEGQMDDPTNIHGLYARISRVLDDRTVEVELIHPQQLGVEITRVGDTVDLVNRNTLLTVQTATVAAVRTINKRFTIVSFADHLNPALTAGDSLTSAGWTCGAVIRGCKTGRNRARGFLISTPGKVLVENNHFHNPGAAILIAGDANYWFESHAVRDITIRNNHFDNCLYGTWGRAVIDVYPEIKPEHRNAGYYHRGIKVIDNTFDVLDPRIIKAHSVDGLTVTGNQINLSSKYPAQPIDVPTFDVTDCRDVVIENNPGAEGLAESLAERARV